jgi:hypothetical protein
MPERGRRGDRVTAVCLAFAPASRASWQPGGLGVLAVLPGVPAAVVEAVRRPGDEVRWAGDERAAITGADVVLVAPELRWVLLVLRHGAIPVLALPERTRRSIRPTFRRRRTEWLAHRLAQAGLALHLDCAAPARGVLEAAAALVAVPRTDPTLRPVPQAGPAGRS